MSRTIALESRTLRDLKENDTSAKYLVKSVP